MELRRVKCEDLQNLVLYNEKMFPERGRLSCRYLDFIFAKDSQEYNNSFVIDDKGEIRGQIISSTMSYFYKNAEEEGLWSFDLVVDEELRKDAYGLDLMQHYKRSLNNIFATGSGPVALKLNLALGYKMMGEIRKYVGLGNPLYLFSSLFRGVIPISKFPKRVPINKKIFILSRADEVEWRTTPFNEDLWEPVRNNGYMRWRFSNKLHEYAIYKEEQSGDYVVLRTIVKRGITAVVIVDFRCDLSGGRVVDIVNVAKNVARNLYLSIIICGSSHTNIDQVLESKYFKSVGRPRPIIGQISYKERKTDIRNRQFAFVTLADSDGETLW